MRGTFLSLISCTVLTLGGCSQVPNWLKGYSHTPENQTQTTELRSTPGADYQFGENTYEVELYDTAANAHSASHHMATDYSGYEVVLYNLSPVQSVNYTPIDPREAAFVKLNGTSQDTDWRNCEIMSRGYLYASEYDFSLDPHFEVCMRNKGYVLTTEAGSFADNPISARTAGLRGYSQPTGYQTSYSFP